ncbi:MAG: aspartate aminotransferase family protein [Candidatus Omnitrophica bacterium]|nr:aspartate aminotransferase family protein [Candidatus Omnitrophota bacterium]
MNNEKWYKLEDVEKISVQEKVKLTENYLNPGMVKLFKILGFEKPWGILAEGVYITLKEGRKILDMTGGNGVLGLGHNHPRILAARAKIANKKRLEICKGFLSPYVAALASNIANILPGDLQYSFFCGGGAAAIEGALKLAQKHHGCNRMGLAYTDHCFHGKSYAAMSVSSQEENRKHFQLLDKCYKVSYGDAKALERLFKNHSLDGGKKTDICAFIVEPIHGSKLTFPPRGYLKEVRHLCNEYDVLLIVDEIFTGFGKTGFWFAFQNEEIIPDIVCYSKTFGGGKATIAGYTARKPIFLKAYGKPEDSMIHSCTFSGMTEECATAIEVLNIICDEKLIKKANELGNYFGQKIKMLAKKYPKRISSIRGRGLLWGVEVRPIANQIEPVIKKLFPDKSSNLSALTGAIIMTELFHSYDILTYLGFNQRNLVIFSPPLLIKKNEIDFTIEALDKILATNWVVLSHSFGARFISKIGKQLFKKK